MLAVHTLDKTNPLQPPATRGFWPGIVAMRRLALLGRFAWALLTCLSNTGPRSYINSPKGNPGELPGGRLFEQTLFRFGPGVLEGLREAAPLLLQIVVQCRVLGEIKALWSSLYARRTAKIARARFILWADRRSG